MKYYLAVNDTTAEHAKEVHGRTWPHDDEIPLLPELDEGWHYIEVPGHFWRAKLVDGRMVPADQSAPDMDTLRSKKWELVKELRDKQESRGCVTPKGRVDTDAKSVALIANFTQCASRALSNGEEWSVDWTMADNSVVTHSAEEFVELGRVVAAYLNECHTRARDLRQKIDAADSEAALESINVTAAMRGQ